MSTDNFKKYLPPLLLLGLLAGLVIGFWSFIMANIVEPVAILFWVVWRAVVSVDQNIYWMILIVLCSILVIRLIPSENSHISNPAYDYRYRLPNRVEHWRTLIKDAMLGKDESEHLRDNLTKLFISAINQQERRDPMDLEKIHAIGKTSLSTRAQHFLFSPEGRDNMFRMDRLLDLLPRWSRKWVGHFIQQDTISINEILERMEIEMEINHDI